MKKSKVDDGYKHNTFLYVLIKPLILLVVKVVLNPKVIGKKNIPSDDGCIIACNHIHAFDPVILIYSSKRIVRFIAKSELFKGIFKSFFLSFGTIPVDRSKKNPLAVGLAEEYLNEGKVIGIFPEGTRNKSEEILLPFKYGAVRMAKETGKKIVPCALSGSYKFFRSTIKVVYGEAIDISDMELEDANELLREKIILLLEEK